MDYVKYYINSQDGLLYKAHLVDYCGNFHAIPLWYYKNDHNCKELDFKEDAVPDYLSPLDNGTSLSMTHIKSLIKGYPMEKGHDWITDQILIDMKETHDAKSIVLFKHDKHPDHKYRVLMLTLDCTNGREWNINVVYQRFDKESCDKLFSRSLPEFMQKFTYLQTF